MRLDKYLKVSRIIKRRTVAKQACDSGRALVNGRVAKAGAEIKAGDEITVMFGKGDLRLRVLDLKESVKKEEADTLYEIIQ